MESIIRNRHLHAVKIFAELQWEADVDLVSFYNEETGQQITNPWIDESGRFPLDDSEAVATYGLENVRKFVEDAILYLQLT